MESGTNLIKSNMLSTTARLELVATFVAQNAAEEGQHTGLLARELEAKSPDGLDDGNLELVGNFGHEASNLLHQSIDTSLVTSLEQRRNSKRGNGAVRVGDEELNVLVARSDGDGLERSKVVEDAEGGKLGNGAGRGEEHLEDVDGLVNLLVGDVAEVADGLGSLKVDHFRLVAQPANEKLRHGLAQRSILLGELRCEPDQHDGAGRS